MTTAAALSFPAPVAFEVEGRPFEVRAWLEGSFVVIEAFDIETGHAVGDRLEVSDRVVERSIALVPDLLEQLMRTAIEDLATP